MLLHSFKLLWSPGGETADFLQPYKPGVATKLLPCCFEGIFFAFLCSVDAESVFLR